MSLQIQRLAGPGSGVALVPTMVPPSPAGAQGRYEPYQRMHRLLRGRYKVALILAGVCGLAGAAIGYKALKPQFRSEGMLILRSELPTVLHHTDEGGPIPLYEEYVESQALMIESRNILDKALVSPAWQQVGGKNTDAALAEFAKSLTVEHPGHTQNINVYFLDPDPTVAAAAVNAVITQYEYWFHMQTNRVDDSRTMLLRGQEAKYEGTITYDQNQVDAITAEFSTDKLQPLYDIRLETVRKLESRYADAKSDLDLMQHAGASGEKAQLTNRQIAMIDQGMAKQMDRCDNALVRYQEDVLHLGTSNYQVQQDLTMLKALRKEADDYAKDFRDLQAKMAQTPGAQHSGFPGLVQSVDSLKQETDALQKQLAQARADLDAVGTKKLALEKAEEDLTTNKAGLAEVQDRIMTLEMEAHGLGLDRLNVLNYGDRPVKPYKDRRLILASVGGLGGMMLPLSIFLLIGLADRRYRYSDDAEAHVDHPPLLGILPNLPSRLEDPQVAAVAAHCIHQVRIMLQVGCQPGKSRVFMITSGGTGDGKTSLTMALGLSFAASGSRTLMIDADIIGQALSHRLAMSKEPGLLQSLVDGSVRGRIKETATRNLWILPAGTTETRYANVLSSTLAERVLQDARALFDTIIVDTGPILGSLEASVLAAQVDGVVLTVSRGEQQPMVQRALNQLHALGAHVSGLVFNRAEKRDFHRSVASASIRSQSAAEAAPPILAAESDESSRFGPLARSVASFIPESDGSSNGNGNGKHVAAAPARPVAAQETSVP